MKRSPCFAVTRLFPRLLSERGSLQPAANYNAMKAASSEVAMDWTKQRARFGVKRQMFFPGDDSEGP